VPGWPAALPVTPDLSDHHRIVRSSTRAAGPPGACDHRTVVPVDRHQRPSVENQGTHAALSPRLCPGPFGPGDLLCRQRAVLGLQPARKSPALRRVACSRPRPRPRPGDEMDRQAGEGAQCGPAVSWRLERRPACGSSGASSIRQPRRPCLRRSCDALRFAVRPVLKAARRVRLTSLCYRLAAAGEAS